MPRNTLRWEAITSLKHHCPICSLALASEKARTRCLGKHVEWCRGYHALFRTGWSGRCSACRTMDEQHEKRHRGIAEKLQQLYKASSGPYNASSSETECSCADKTKKKERKTAKKACKPVDRETIVTTAHIQTVARTLHAETPGAEGAGERGANEEDGGEREEEGGEVRGGCSGKRRGSDESDVEQKEVGRVVAALCAEWQVNGGQGGALMDSLVAAVREDLFRHREERRATAQRATAFWQWGNAKVYRAFQANGGDWDAKRDARGGG